MILISSWHCLDVGLNFAAFGAILLGRTCVILISHEPQFQLFYRTGETASDSHNPGEQEAGKYLRTLVVEVGD